jgi:hypothetical protein
MEASLSGKWVELIREIAPQVSRMAILFNPQTAPFARYYLDTFRSAATALSVESIEAPVHSPAEIEAVMTKLGRETGAGIVVTHARNRRIGRAGSVYCCLMPTTILRPNFTIWSDREWRTP